MWSITCHYCGKWFFQKLLILHIDYLGIGSLTHWSSLLYTDALTLFRNDCHTNECGKVFHIQQAVNKYLLNDFWNSSARKY